MARVGRHRGVASDPSLTRGAEAGTGEKKRRRPDSTGVSNQALRRGLDRLYADGLRSLVPGLLFIGHLHPLVERPKALSVDLALVDEQVLVSLVRSDEAEALVRVEPLDGSGCHLAPPSYVLVRRRMPSGNNCADLHLG